MTLSSAYGLVPEPDVIIYGKVINRYKGADTILNEGQLIENGELQDFLEKIILIVLSGMVIIMAVIFPKSS